MRIYHSFIFLFIYSGITVAQISPGDLSKAHAKFEGINNCTKCHVLGEKVTNAKCLDCHSEIKRLINEKQGYHSGSEVKGKECWACHSEHNGRNFRIINFDKNKFDHNNTTFHLTGKHSVVACSECHQLKYVRDDIFKKRPNSFIGLSKKCSVCHEDYHQNTLSDNCENCHDTKSFRPAPKFDHNSTDFKLTGAHLKTECIMCHPKIEKAGKGFQRFGGIMFSSCSNCHKDAHQGNFGANCQGCHITSSFRNINKEAFDHNKTNFPLAGRHNKVACNDCHKENLTKNLKHDKCIDCHDDYHEGAFVVNSTLRDCSGCHTVNGFKPSTFTIEQHNELKFSLTGGHLAVPCKNCHYKEDDWVFKNIGAKCIGCHQNVHKSEITEEFMPGNDCTGCHNTANWITVAFNHDKTKYPLSGKHSDVKCGSCHYKEKKEFKFTSLKSDCETCHTDIHFGQFKKDGHSDCFVCHSFNNWKPVKFDHNKTKFSLEGAHQKVRCSACHKRIELNGNSFVKFHLEDFKCASCHS